MPSSNKTANYSLNKWISTDKPIMSDFNSDNEILDNIIGTHISNTSIHLTSDEKDRVSKPYFIQLVPGNGAESKEITFSFMPKMVLYCLRGKPFTSFDNSNNYNVINGGFAIGNYFGASEGMLLDEAKLTVSQTQSAIEGQNFINLNRSGGQYLCIAFK